MKLIKLSAPGWEKEFDTEEELKAELFSHICGACCEGEIIKKEDNPEAGMEKDYVLWSPVNKDSPISDMLWTACGCEYCVEDEDGN